MSMEKLRCPTCSHYALCSIGGEITDSQARTCKSYSYIPTPSMPRPIYGKIERYEYDVESGTISCKVIQTNADRIRSMTDEELAEFMRPYDSGCPRWKENPLPCSDWDNCGECWLKWLKDEVSE